jgi:hypothetical protein
LIALAPAGSSGFGRDSKSEAGRWQLEAGSFDIEVVNRR